MSPGRCSVSHGFDREDRARLHSYGHYARPPRWQEKLSAYEDYSHRESQHQDSSQWQDRLGCLEQMERSTNERQFIMASSTTFLFSRQVLPSTNFPGPFPPLIPPGGAPSAAPQLDSRPLTAFSTSHQHYQKTKKRQPRSDTGYQSRGSSSIPAGHIQISLKDDHKKEWIKWAKFGLNHKHRMKAASELSEEEKPKPCFTIDHDRFHKAYSAIRSIDRRVPLETAKLAAHLISGSRLIDDIDLSKAYLMELRVTNMLALVFPLPSAGSHCLNPSKGNTTPHGP